MQPRPGHEYPAKFEEPYRCRRDCQLGEGWRSEVRAGRGCTRRDLPRVRWDVSARELYSRPARYGALHFGRFEDPSLAGKHELGVPQNPARPLEAAGDGCPGGWYRSPFVDSVIHYQRRRTEGGGRVPNPFFDRAPWQVQAAVLYLEQEEERWAAYREEINAARRRAGPRKPKKTGR